MWEEDCLPAVYAFPPPNDEWGDPEPLATLVRRHLKENGIEPRIYFEDHSAITDECDTCDRINAGELSKLEDWEDRVRLHKQISPYGTSSIP